MQPNCFPLYGENRVKRPAFMASSIKVTYKTCKEIFTANLVYALRMIVSAIPFLRCVYTTSTLSHPHDEPSPPSQSFCDRYSVLDGIKLSGINFSIIYRAMNKWKAMLTGYKQMLELPISKQEHMFTAHLSSLNLYLPHGAHSKGYLQSYQ